MEEESIIKLPMNIGIVGLGLIGGSLGLDFRASHHHVLGLSRSQKTCDIAARNGVVDDAGTNPSILQSADVVFLCPPIGSIQAVFEKIQDYLSLETIITDVGSVKGAIAPKLHDQWPYFIGGHPMAGTSESGIEAAQSNLFLNRPYVLTPLETTNPKALDTVTRLVQDLGATLYIASPTEHDRAVALISHLPIIISSALISSCTDSRNSAVVKLAQSLASSGFRDTSRVGGGNPELGRMVAQFNQQEVLRAIDTYQQNLLKLRQIIANQNWDKLESWLAATHESRPAFVEDQESIVQKRDD